MELSQVRYFTTLCRTLNFTRAAELCNVTQPAFTRAIARLEEELGGALLFRERSLTQLTELGRDMRPYLQAMLDAADAAGALAAARKQGAMGSLKIGLGPGIAAGVIAPAVREVVQMLPDVPVQFEEAAPALLIEAMLMDRLDCALLAEEGELPERFNRWALYCEAAVVVLPPEHRLVAKNALCAEDVLGETILVGERCGGFAAQLSGVFGAPLRVQRCDGAVSQMLEMVAAGLGIALLSERLRFAPPLAVRRFGPPELTRQVMLTAVAGRKLNPAAAGFVRLCRARAFG
ncbi:MAG TPA: LysR family transcriptional regulator [Acidocella sp.]|nr:LysR family transcriptional regulator [Acidocella sp.]